VAPRPRAWHPVDSTDPEGRSGSGEASGSVNPLDKEVQVEKLLKRFEHVLVVGLLGMMALVVFLATVELAVIIVQRMLSGKPQMFLLDISDMLEIFGFFMMILIGLELIETIKIYLVDESIHVEVICLVAIVAIARKVIILDLYKLPPASLLGIAAIILALSVGYFFLKKAMEKTPSIKRPLAQD
jgi:uncharacterized membrane protein (DUF373 family)